MNLITVKNLMVAVSVLAGVLSASGADGRAKYFNNMEKRKYDGGVEGLKDADYPGANVFKTGPPIQDEEDAWYRSQ